MSETPKKKAATPAKKVSDEVLLKRRLGRIKAAETMALKIKRSGIEKADNRLAPSLFHAVPLINQKNYYTDYLKKDDQIMFLRKRKEMFGVRRSNAKEVKKSKADTPADLDDLDADDVEDVAVDDASDPEKRARLLKRIVIHPGLRNIRIGFLDDPYPKTFPNVIAVPRFVPKEHKELETEFGPAFDAAKATVEADFKERMRFYKRRILPHSHEMVCNFNKKVEPEIISDLNDPHKVEWIKDDDPKYANERYFVGEDALNLETDDRYQLRYPLIYGRFNEKDYRSSSELIGDIQLILESILRKSFDVPWKKYPEHNIVLVVPDLYDKAQIEAYISMFLEMRFNAVSVIQELMAATFGAGVSQACIVDIGAQTTTVSCIDEGMVLNDSRIRMDFGGDDITRAFNRLLIQLDFPCKLDLNDHHDNALVTSIKDMHTTFLDADIAVQLYDFIRRRPTKNTEKYQYKIFDEVMLAPMGIFYPELFDKPELDPYKKAQNALFSKPVDIYSGKNNNPTSAAQKLVHSQKTLFPNATDEDIIKRLILMGQDELNANNLNLRLNELSRSEEESLLLCKLDLAIIESITNAGKHDLSLCRKFYENLLIVGGVGKTPSIDVIMADRINLWRPRILASGLLDSIVKVISSEFEKPKSALLKEQNKLPEAERLLETEVSQQLESILDDIVARRLPELVESPEFRDDLSEILILSPPRDIDPLILTWKGATVFARLKIINELWITYNDWDMLGSRALHYKVLFSY